MAIKTPTSELEAVNYIIGTIGLFPVNSIEIAIADVSIARQVLQETSRKVQSRGWWFNTDTKYSFPIDINNEIVVPGEAVNVDASDYFCDVTMRGNKLYNRETHSFKFDEAVKCDVIWLQDFSEVPQVAREYITMKAARQFQKRTASEILMQITEDDEKEAWVELLHIEAENEDTNLITNDRRSLSMTGRRFNP